MPEFKVEADPGKMKHTLTGLRTEFKNLHVHLIMATCYKPFRQELMRRPEVGSESGMNEALRTMLFESLDCWRKSIQKYQSGEVLDPNITLEDRRSRRTDFAKEILEYDNDFEKISREKSATHTDRVLPPSTNTPESVTFDYTGLNDKDMAQPTPDRVQHPILRALLIGMDKIVVEMSRSHSADNEMTIISQEAVIWLTWISDLWRMVDDYDPNSYPFYPTATSLNERDTVWNADGEFDPNVSDGDASGERAGTNRTVGGSSAS